MTSSPSIDPCKHSNLAVTWGTTRGDWGKCVCKDCGLDMSRREPPPPRLRIVK